MTLNELANLVWPYMRHQPYCDRFPPGEVDEMTWTDCHCGLIGIRRRIKDAIVESQMERRVNTERRAETRQTGDNEPRWCQVCRDTHRPNEPHVGSRG